MFISDENQYVGYTLYIWVKRTIVSIGVLKFNPQKVITTLFFLCNISLKISWNTQLYRDILSINAKY